MILYLENLGNRALGRSGRVVMVERRERPFHPHSNAQQANCAHDLTVLNAFWAPISCMPISTIGVESF